MNFTDAWVEPGYRDLISQMTNDDKDWHFLPPQSVCGSETIVTYNLKHFPEESLQPFGIVAKHLDEFLIDLYHLNGEAVVHELHSRAWP